MDAKKLLTLFIFSFSLLLSFPRFSQEEENKEEGDYWKDIEFGPEDFAEVRRYIKAYYIDPDYNKNLAWIEAANSALHEMDPKRELLPEDFYEGRKNLIEEKLRLTGNVYKINPRDKYVIHFVQKERNDEIFNKNLYTKEIKKEKEKIKKRNKELQEAWKTINFTKKEFDKIIEHIFKEEEKKQGFKRSQIYIAATKGYLSTLDPHSNIISRKAWEDSTKNATDSSFEGIGAVLTKKGEYIVVESPMEGQPAQIAGLRAGDIILYVNHKSVKGFSLNKVVKKIRGPRGTTVTLTVRRIGEPEEIEITIVREHIGVKNVYGTLLENFRDIGYIKLSSFVPDSSKNIKEVYQELIEKSKGKRLRGLIFDVRGNSGGLLSQSVEIADFFLEDGLIVSVKNPSLRDEKYRATKGGVNIPLVILVNSASASASEIFASAIQENARGLIIGEKTFGKASVQSLLTPIRRNDYYIKLTVARYYSPSGRTIQVSGVQPDIEVPPELGKETPPGFREEDLIHHLLEINSSYESPFKKEVSQIEKCISKIGKAEKIFHSDPSPQIKFDYQLMKAGDVIECYILIKKKIKTEIGTN